MVFPIESEDRTLRNLLMMFQDHARLVVEIYRKVLVMIDSLVKGEGGDLRGRLDEIEKVQLESLEIKRNIMRELHESGSILFNREDLFRLISKAGEVIDYIESVGVHLWGISDRKWKIPEGLGVGLVEMAGAVLDSLIKLRESLLSLGFNSERSLKLTDEVAQLERKVDTLHRRLDMAIVTSDMALPLILTLRDVSTKLENVVDTVEAEADLIRILAL